MDLSHKNTRLLIDTCKSAGLLRNQCAYVLATAWHETGGYRHTREVWGPTAAQKRYEGRKDLGNTTRGDGKRFLGRGFVQITGRRNYTIWSKRLGIDLIKEPQLAERPDIAARVIVDGMKLGAFTGKCLADYITRTKSEFYGARRIVNGTDKADLIAGYADQFDALLAKDGYDVAAPETKPDAPTFEAEAVIRGVQEKLVALGYTEVGGLDGKVGPLTRAAILAFRADNKLPLTPTVDADMIAALAVAKPRKLAPERTEATSADVREKVPEVRSNWLAKVGAFVVGIPAMLGAGFDGILNNLGIATGYIQPVKDALWDVPGWVWLLLVAAVALGLGLIARHGEAKGVEAFQDGSRR